MPFSSGTFILYTPGNPVVTGTTIASTWANNTLNDIATGLSTCLLKDGSQTVTGNIPMSNFKFTGLASGTASTDSATINNIVNATGSLLTGVAGTNTVTAGALSSFAYTSGQRVVLLPANTNTGATTLNVTPSGGSALGAKNIFAWGAACAGGELVQSVPALLEYDGTQFNIINPQTPTLSNVLSGDVPLNNVSNYFDGPIVAQGTVGTWWVSGTVTLQDTGGAASFAVRLWDGTSAITTTFVTSTATSTPVSVSLSGKIKNPSGSLRISVKDLSHTTGVIIFNSSGDGRDSSITAMRIG